MNAVAIGLSIPEAAPVTTAPLPFKSSCIFKYPKKRLQWLVAEIDPARKHKGSPPGCGATHRSRVYIRSRLSRAPPHPTALFSCSSCNVPKNLRGNCRFSAVNSRSRQIVDRQGNLRDLSHRKEDSWQKRERIQITTAGAEFLDLQGQNSSEIS